MRLSRLSLLWCVIALAIATPVRAQQVLRWGGDSEGGAPFVEADPRDPSKLVGFDVERPDRAGEESGVHAPSNATGRRGVRFAGRGRGGRSYGSRFRAGR